MRNANKQTHILRLACESSTWNQMVAGSNPSYSHSNLLSISNSFLTCGPDSEPLNSVNIFIVLVFSFFFKVTSPATLLLLVVQVVRVQTCGSAKNYRSPGAHFLCTSWWLGWYLSE